MEPGSDNEPDPSVITSVAKHSLRFNTSIVKCKKKKKKSVITQYLNNSWLPGGGGGGGGGDR